MKGVRGSLVRLSAVGAEPLTDATGTLIVLRSAHPSSFTLSV